MLIQSATEPGDKLAANEDCVASTPHVMVVLDGLTARTDTGCLHGVAWFAERLATSILEFSRLDLVEALRAAIAHTASLHAESCDLSNPATPCAAVGIVKIERDRLRYLALGDVTIVVDSGSNQLVISDLRVNKTALHERAEADALPSGSSDKAAALVRMKRAEIAARNTPGGYWIAAADPSVADEAITGEMPLSAVRRVAILTDGAARAVDVFNLYDWRGALDMLATSGPRELIAQVRKAEDSDPLGKLWPRNKISDDATVIFLDRV
jgi:Protein phosphatase 2C